MISLNPEELSEKENYKFLIGSIIPRPIALISSLSKDNIFNVAPFSYFNIVTSDPPIVAVACQRKEGQLKDTTRNLLEKKEAVIHIVDAENVGEANKTAANLEADESEFDLTNFTRIDSDKVAVPALKESKIRFEVKLHQHVPVVDEGVEKADLLLLKIEQYHIADEIYSQGRIDPNGLAAVSRLAGHDYAEIGRQFTMARPD